MLVCILLTGALRTIKKTIPHFKNNVMAGDVHVYACLENDTSESNESWGKWLKEEVGESIKAITWMSRNDPVWLMRKTQILSNINIEQRWLTYLSNSGSIVEYYQLELAYKNMCVYENNNTKYEYVIRCRTDTIFAKKVDFHWLQWNDNDIKQRVDIIKQNIIQQNIEITHENVLKYVMISIWDDSILTHLHDICVEYSPNEDISKEDIFNNDMSSTLCEYIKNGRYIVTLRKNLLYIVKRKYFYLIPSVCTLYGTLRRDLKSDDYWFNAEAQFISACYHSGLSIYDYDNHHLDGLSLYQYDKARYFDENYTIINPNLIYCIIRN